jgi:N utilization substance protein A
VREVYLDDDARDATVVVPDDQLALAIGKEGMNARLAARLTGWKVDIKSDTEFATEEAEAAFAGEGAEEEFTGRCGAILSTGKRCPNAALPGSRYCGVPAHQELAHKEAAGEVPAEEVPAATPVATQEEVVEAEPVAVAAEEPAEEPVAEAQPEPEQAHEDQPAEPVAVAAEEPAPEEPVVEAQPEPEQAQEDQPAA